jgi:hypothetical protein
VSDLHIILHCLPREIDELERIVNHLKRSSHFLSPDDEVILDFTLNLSDKLTDWETSQLPKEFFADKFEMMKQKCDWTFKNIFEINDGNRCLGINDKRRNSIRENNPKNFMYLDTDVYFSMFNLSYIFRALEQINNEYYILNSQLLRLWDSSWNMISNERYIPMGYDSKIWLKYDPFKLDSEVFEHSSTIGIKELNGFKFGGGWFNVFSANLLKEIDIPDSLSSYGLDDTFVEEGCRMMKQKGYDIKQYTLDNMLVCENRRYRDLNPYVNFITDKTNSDEFRQAYRDNANKHYPNELQKLSERL